MAQSRSRPIHQVSLGNHVALVCTCLLVLSSFVLLPLAVFGVVMGIARPSTQRIYTLIEGGDLDPQSRSLLHVDMIDIDDEQRTMKMRVSGTHICADGCTWSVRILFVSAAQDGPLVEGLPPSQAMNLSPADIAVTQDITLPISGEAIRYPFDRYRLVLGVILERVYPDGSTLKLSQEESRHHLRLTLQTDIPREVMQSPRRLDPRTGNTGASGYEYASLHALTFTRPLYLQVMTGLLVLLTTVAACYVVFMRPLADLVVNAGALVLGIWGIRSVLLGFTAQPFTTAVDLWLSIVILFLLVTISVRALHFLQHRCGVHMPLLHLLVRDGPAPSGGGGRPPDHVPQAPSLVRSR